jgi:hypothetical protein
MKQVEMVVDRLFRETMGVLNGTVNAQNGLVSARMVDSLVKAASADSRHQLSKKKVPVVKFFDKEYTDSQLKNQLKGNK